MSAGGGGMMYPGKSKGLPASRWPLAADKGFVNEDYLGTNIFFTCTSLPLYTRRK